MTNITICIDAAKRGDLDTLANHLDKDFDRDGVCTLHVIAIESGRIDILQCIIDHDYPLFQDIVYGQYAAIYGRFEMLKFLRSIDARWDEWTAIWAANRGHVDMFQWAIDNGCPYDKVHVKMYALMGNHPAMLAHLNIEPSILTCKYPVMHEPLKSPADEAEERLRFLEGDHKQIQDKEMRHQIVRLYGQMIQTIGNVTTEGPGDTTGKDHVFAAAIEFRKQAVLILGKEQMDALFGTDGDVEELRNMDCCYTESISI